MVLRKIAFYGKGGIGKSTTAANLAVVFTLLGYRVMVVGCDPKADSTLLLMGGRRIEPVLTLMQRRGRSLSLEEVVHCGFNGVLCVEAGGPVPGQGCAGRGIIMVLEVLQELGAFHVLRPDFVLYDVPGDVVCGGFAAPMREGHAREIVIVTSGEKMALYAAENILRAIRHLRIRGGPTLAGIVLNCRNVADEEETVKAFASEMGVEILGVIPRDPTIPALEKEGKTVVEGKPFSHAGSCYFNLAQKIVSLGKKKEGEDEAAPCTD